ncbi:MAG: type II/IV secretion system protein [Gammaproteobacteria bacterium]|nr:type II/IV secretion system protein [Gammaproteobacteria bacterium]
MSAAGAQVLFPEDPGATLPDGTAAVLTMQAPWRSITRAVRFVWHTPCDQGTRAGLEFVEQTGYDPATHRLAIGQVRVDPSCALKIPANIALRRAILPFVELDGVVQVAAADPDNVDALRVAERLLKKPLKVWEADKDQLAPVIQTIYGQQAAVVASPQAGKASEDALTASVMTEELLYAAYLRQASDIHIDPHQAETRIRFRVDGKLEVYASYPAATHLELLTRLKVMSGLDIAEKRAPQDGRFTYRIPGGLGNIDVRAATLPTKYGERMTLRLLAAQTEALTMERLGLSKDHQAMVDAFLHRNQGMMILTGPTGSGKTTTLYGAIRVLKEERSVNIMTVEDPIEYEIDGIAQTEVDTAEKVTFAKALRSMLRHDPDVVMVGEIRDGETADIAIKAALTGHMVLGTLHTNSAAATVTRLLDMGVAPYLVAATLRLIVAQRLVRRLCKHCRIPRALTEREAELLTRPDLAGTTVYEGQGCIYCAGKGYAGRIGLYEMLPLRSEWSRIVAQGHSDCESELQALMRKDGLQFLLDDGIAKLLAGQTSMSEVMEIALSW